MANAKGIRDATPFPQGDWVRRGVGRVYCTYRRTGENTVEVSIPVSSGRTTTAANLSTTGCEIYSAECGQKTGPTKFFSGPGWWISPSDEWLFTGTTQSPKDRVSAPPPTVYRYAEEYEQEARAIVVNATPPLSEETTDRVDRQYPVHTGYVPMERTSRNRGKPHQPIPNSYLQFGMRTPPPESIREAELLRPQDSVSTLGRTYTPPITGREYSRVPETVKVQGSGPIPIRRSNGLGQVNGGQFLVPPLTPPLSPPFGGEGRMSFYQDNPVGTQWPAPVIPGPSTRPGSGILPGQVLDGCNRPPYVPPDRRTQGVRAVPGRVTTTTGVARNLNLADFLSPDSTDVGRG